MRRVLGSLTVFPVETSMVLNKTELVDALKNEVRILLHLAGKIDGPRLDYRPTPKQRSTLELLRYLSIRGPALLDVAKAGTFDPAAWAAAEAVGASRACGREDLSTMNLWAGVDAPAQ